MTRFLSLFLLLLVFALPVFAQDEPAKPQPLPSDPALLTRMKQELSRKIQEIQLMLGYVSDAQLVETLTNQQAELTRQLLEVTQQMPKTTPIQGFSRAADISPEQMLPGMLDSLAPEPRGRVIPTPDSIPNRRDFSLPMMPMPGGFGGMNVPPTDPYQNPRPPMDPYKQQYDSPNMGGGMGIPPAGMGGMGGYPGGMMGGPTSAMDHDRMWEATPWGPRLPRELTETKQAVDALRKEVADLKDTVKALETQIQLLNRNMLLERTKETGN
ncbi:MAG: hypothetical protein LBI05_05985 [Planctomycetaceae bacterium]|jgi:hypothetical protein|nr:hypothetical protein [Planctomycetaceae bacterium]